MQSRYPEPVTRLASDRTHAGSLPDRSASGRSVSFRCGVQVSFEIGIEKGTLRSVGFTSNGCGWAVAAAECLARIVSGARLQDLHALKDAVETLGGELGTVPEERSECVQLAVISLQKALAELREAKVREWAGDSALVCSCFGVSEDTIEEAATSGTAVTVEEIGELCSAGTGCGSCQPLILEILDSV